MILKYIGFDYWLIIFQMKENAFVQKAEKMYVHISRSIRLYVTLAKLTFHVRNKATNEKRSMIDLTIKK